MGAIRESASRVVAHVASLARLQRELARTELERKGASIGAGAAVGIAAGVLSLFAVGFGLAALAATLALVLDWWLALLIVFVLLLALALGLGILARRLVRSGTPLEPEQAIEEAKLTWRALKGAGTRDG